MVTKVKSKKVYSPYYPENDYVNPHYPYGLNKEVSQEMLDKSIPLSMDRSQIFKKDILHKTKMKNLKNSEVRFTNTKINFI